MNESIRIALAGQPNSGKSTMFNAITGGAARVGNYPGITVERCEGRFRKNGTIVHVTDLPGAYSLTSYTMEEVVARDVLVYERPDVVVDVMDASALERSLYLAVQLMELGVPLVIGLNMMDEVRRRGVRIDSRKLSELLRVPVIECAARRGEGKDELMTAVVEQAREKHGAWQPLEISYGPDIDPVLDDMTAKIEAAGFMTARHPARWVALKYIEEDENVIAKGRQAGPLAEELEEMVGRLSEHMERTLRTYPEAVIADYRYGFINSVLRQGIITREDEFRRDVSDKADAVLTNRLLGPLIMLGVLWAMFYVTFTVGQYPQGWLEEAFAWLGARAQALLPDGLLESLLVSGVIEGVGAVLGFTPLICIMFAMLVFLEDLGYMARVSYMLDRVFRVFGLHGASVMPLVISGGLPGGCAVPGVMAARTLRSPKERIATILTAPFSMCGAKVTAFILLIGAFFPDNPTLVMFLLTLFSWVMVLVVSRLLRWTVLAGEATPFVMELPPYRLPTLYGVAAHTWERIWQYIKKAGTVILVISILMWAAMTFPQLPEREQAQFQTAREALETRLTGADGPEAQALRQRLATLERAEQQAAVKNSLAGRAALGLESVTQYAGFPWQANIALLGAFTAKEVFVSTMATVYAKGEYGEPEGETLSRKLRDDPAFTRPAVLSLFIFLLLYAPCTVTLSVIMRETSFKWGIMGLVVSLTVAYALSVAVYQIGMLL